jgi:hypothetical protein
MPAVGLADPDLGFFSAQQVRTEKKTAKESALGLIQVVSGYLTATTLYGGLIEQFQWQWTWKVVEKGKDFVVQFPSVEKLKMMMEFDEFKLKGTGAYIKVSPVTKKVVPVGRFYSVWARAEGVPDEVKHYKGICEVGSLIGAVDDVDMQILADLDVVRFQVDVRSIKKFPMVKQFAITPWMYNITFSIERILEEGTLDEVVTVTNVTQKSSDEQMVDEEEQARAAKKLKASTEESKMDNNKVDREDGEEEKDKGMDGDKGKSDGRLTEEKEVTNRVEADNIQKEFVEAEKEEEEREEELVDFEDSQDKLGDQEEEDVFESQESFTTKVNKITAVSKTSEELIAVKMEHDKSKNKAIVEEPRRCPRLKEQEDADRTELAMKRTAKKNEITGNDTTLTVLNSSDAVLLDMNSKLGVVSSKDGDDYSIVSVIKNLENTRKIIYDESLKKKDLVPPEKLDIFTQVTEMVDDMDEDSDDELEMHTSPSRTQLSIPANKIVKLCSPVFRVELVKKKRGRPPKVIK